MIPKGVSLVRLGLVYQRAKGSTRIRGEQRLADSRLQLENKEA